MKPVILFRKDLDSEAELEVAKKYITCVEYRSQVPSDSLVVGRYSVLPYYRELEVDLTNIGSQLINSRREHGWIADFDYYEDLKDFTFPTWHEKDFPYSGYDGPVVIKGRTNSRKHQWSTKMFAEDRAAAIRVASELANDPFIGPQGLIYRKYIPLKTYELEPISNLPITNEWRLFFYKERLITYGYYWSIASDEVLAKVKLSKDGLDFANIVAKEAASHVNFFVLDIAEKEEGGWILVEVNDGQQSGLSMNNPFCLYDTLASFLAQDLKSTHD